MLVLFAKQMGMCFGVKDALQITEEIEVPDQVTILGELVHNPTVQKRLQSRGFAVQAEHLRDDAPYSPSVMVTAHGISDKLRRQLREAGKKLIDTTCPLVRRVHKTVLHLQKKGFHIALVGKRGHVEVEGLIGDLTDFTIFEDVGEVSRLEAARIAVVSQTTSPPEVFVRVARRVRELHPDSEVQVVDTICSPTRDRQTAVEELLRKVEMLVVVGGKNSNNTRRLGEMATRCGKPWVHVEDAEELDLQALQGFARVGLTAGTSTPDEVIASVHRRLLSLDRQACVA